MLRFARYKMLVSHFLYRYIQNMYTFYSSLFCFLINLNPPLTVSHYHEAMSKKGAQACKVWELIRIECSSPQSFLPRLLKSSGIGPFSCLAAVFNFTCYALFSEYPLFILVFSCSQIHQSLSYISSHKNIKQCRVYKQWWLILIFLNFWVVYVLCHLVYWKCVHTFLIFLSNCSV